MTQRRLHRLTGEALSARDPGQRRINRVTTESLTQRAAGERQTLRLTVEVLRPNRTTQPQRVQRVAVEVLRPKTRTVSMADLSTTPMQMDPAGFWRPLSIIAAES